MSTTAIVEGMSMAEYQARPEVSSHDLALIHKAPFAYRYAKDNPEPEDESMGLGSLLHLAVLEPEQLENQVAILPADAPPKPLPIHRKMQAENRMSIVATERINWWDQWAEETKGKQNVKAADLAKVQGMHKSLMATPHVRDAVAAKGLREASAFFHHHEVACRMRPDLWAVEDLFDLKSTGDCTRDAFTREIYKKGYHRQASFYVKGAEALGKPVKQFVWIAIETKPPFLCAAHIIKHDSPFLALGEVDNFRALAQYKRAMESGYWPGVRQYPEEVEMPSYAA